MSKINFIHVPKTGGTYFHHCVLRHNKQKIKDLGHAFCYQAAAYNWKTWIQSTKYQKRLNKWTDLPVFQFNKDELYHTIVRNPFELFYSYYSYQGNDGSKGWGNVNEIHSFHTFNDFVEFYLSENTWHLPVLKKSLFAMIKDRHNNFIINDYIKYDRNNFQSKIISYCNRNDLKFKQSNDHRDLNTNKDTDYYKKHYRRQYTDNQVQRLSDLWQDDLKYFNYSF